MHVSPRSSRPLAALFLVAVTAAAAGQDTAAPDPADVLRGPTVEDRQVPGVISTFGETTAAQPGARYRVQHRMFLQAFRALDQEAPPELHLTPSQAETIRSLEQAFQREMRTFRREHRDELRELQRKGREARRRRADTPNTPPTDDELSLNEQRRALMAQGPDVQDHHVRVWDVLTDDQADWMRTYLDARVQDQAMGDAMTDRGPRDDAMREAQPRSRAAGIDAMTITDPKVRALVDRLERLPPHVRERVIARFMDGLDNVEQRLDPPPAPSMDDVDVPDPDDAGSMQG